jgi:glutathione S-transferase
MGNSQPKLKLTYFDIQGVAEKIRVALWLQNIAFEDERVNFSDWKEMKGKTKHGVLPQLTIGGDEKKPGQVVTDSEAILRYVATLKSETLYPVKDPMRRLLVDQVLGLHGDMLKAVAPAIYLNIRPENYGYPEGFQGTEEGKARVLALRTKAAQEIIPRYAGYFEQFLADDAKFLAGNNITIADLAAYFSFARYQSGQIDHIPTTVVDEFKTLTAWLARVKDAVQGYYDAKEAEQKAKEEAEQKAKEEAEQKAKEEAAAAAATAEAKAEEPAAAEAKAEEPAAEEAKAEEPAAEEAKAEEPAAEEAKAEEPAAAEAKAEEPAAEEAKAEEPAAEEAKAEEPAAAASDEAAPAAE